MTLTIRTIGTCASLLLLPLSLGCSPLIADASDSSGGESASGSSSTGEDSTSSEGETTASSGMDSTSGSPASSSSSTSTSTSTGDSDGDSSTGEDLPTPDVELVLRHDEGDDAQLSLCRVFEGVAEPCELLDEADTGRNWGTPVFLSDRRILMTGRDGSDSELRIASLDGPPTTTRVDDPSRPHEAGSTVLVVPTDESVIYSNGNTAFRVALDGLNVVTTTTLGSHSAPFRPTLDPQGRYLLLEDSAAYRIGLDGSGVADITPEGAIPFLTVDGEGGFRRRSMGGGVQRLEYLALGEGVGAPIQLMPERVAIFFGIPFPDPKLVRPAATHPGVLTPLDIQEETLFYVGFEDGAGLPPVALNAPNTHAYLFDLAHEAPPWSPDGRWLAFGAWGFDSSNELWIADFGDSHEPTLSRVGSGSTWYSYAWAADSSALYLTVGNIDTHTERVLLTDEGPIAQVVGAPGDSPAALSPDGRTLVVTHQDEGSPDPSLYIIDVEGPEPGERVLAAESAPGRRYLVGLFSNDSRFYAYNRDGDVFVASMDEPSAPHISVGTGALRAVVPNVP